MFFWLLIAVFSLILWSLSMSDLKPRNPRNADLVTTVSFFAGVGLAAAAAFSCTANDSLPAAIIASSGSYTCPVNLGEVRGPDTCASEGGRFSSRRGTNRIHQALDINVYESAPVRASRRGLVVVAGDWGKMGKMVLLDHQDGDYTIYGHLKEVTVKEGQATLPGESIGSVGYTGNAECLKENKLPAHLHFAIYRSATPGMKKQAYLLRKLREEGHFHSLITGDPNYGPLDPERELNGCW